MVLQKKVLVLKKFTPMCLLGKGYITHSESVSCSVVSDSVTPWTLAHQAPLSIEFSRQEYWSGLSFPSPGNLPKTGIKFRSPALQDSLSII